MATLIKRRNGDDSTSWDAIGAHRRLSRDRQVLSHPTRSETPGGAHRSRRQAARTLASARGMTLQHRHRRSLVPADQSDCRHLRLLARRTRQRAARRDHYGARRAPRDRLLGAFCRGHGYRTTKPRSPATVRDYLIALPRLFTLAVKETRVTESNPCEQVRKPKASTEVVNAGQLQKLQRTPVRCLADAERVGVA